MPSSSSSCSEREDLRSNEYVVKRIEGHMKVSRAAEYHRRGTINASWTLLAKTGYAFRVRWQGYSPDDDTWEPFDNFSPGNSVLLKYCRDNGIAVPREFQKPLSPKKKEEKNLTVSDSDSEDDRNELKLHQKKLKNEKEGRKKNFLEKKDVAVERVDQHRPAALKESEPAVQKTHKPDLQKLGKSASIKNAKPVPKKDESFDSVLRKMTQQALNKEKEKALKRSVDGCEKEGGKMKMKSRERTEREGGERKKKEQQTSTGRSPIKITISRTLLESGRVQSNVEQQEKALKKEKKRREKDEQGKKRQLQFSPPPVRLWNEPVVRERAATTTSAQPRVKRKRKTPSTIERWDRFLNDHQEEFRASVPESRFRASERVRSLDRKDSHFGKTEKGSAWCVLCRLDRLALALSAPIRNRIGRCSCYTQFTLRKDDTFYLKSENEDIENEESEEKKHFPSPSIPPTLKSEDIDGSGTREPTRDIDSIGVGNFAKAFFKLDCQGVLRGLTQLSSNVLRIKAIKQMMTVRQELNILRSEGGWRAKCHPDHSRCIIITILMRQLGLLEVSKEELGFHDGDFLEAIEAGDMYGADYTSICQIRALARGGFSYNHNRGQGPSPAALALRKRTRDEVMYFVSDGLDVCSTETPNLEPFMAEDINIRTREMLRGFVDGLRRACFAWLRAACFDTDMDPFPLTPTHTLQTCLHEKHVKTFTYPEMMMEVDGRVWLVAQLARIVVEGESLDARSPVVKSPKNEDLTGFNFEKAWVRVKKSGEENEMRRVDLIPLTSFANTTIFQFRKEEVALEKQLTTGQECVEMGVETCSGRPLSGLVFVFHLVAALPRPEMRK